ncbi:MAG TPA: transposase, partial [Thermoanaerobaculia bacterium]|nr:transposase [Thermoanaerobaculia bacterium]
MPIGSDTHAYRQRLPHLVKRDRTYYVTFCTRDREVLSPAARDVVLATCMALHDVLCWFDSVVVMPDHVHLIAVPFDSTNTATVVGRVKGRSAYDINRQLARGGPLWQRDSFDRIVRSDENLQKKRD